MFGGIWPVVQREMRAAARERLNVWLRVGAGLGGIIVFIYTANIFDIADPSQINGQALVIGIHQWVMVLIVALYPPLRPTVWPANGGRARWACCL